MAELAHKRCVPCEGGVAPMSPEAAAALLPQVPGWEFAEGRLAREFEFEDFRAAMAFVAKVADLAEAEGHHPDIHVSYRRVRLVLWTHAIGGLSENDFIVAAKVNRL